jgi:hypothetical protein
MVKSALMPRLGSPRSRGQQSTGSRRARRAKNVGAAGPMIHLLVRVRCCSLPLGSTPW